MDRALAVARAIRDKGGMAESACFDVTDFQQTTQVLEQLQQAGTIQIVVNNAGIYQDGPMAGMTPDHWGTVIDVSLKGFFNVTQPLLLPMIRTRWGRIVNITSISGVIGNRGQVNYAAAKAGLHGATKALRSSWPPGASRSMPWHPGSSQPPPPMIFLMPKPSAASCP